MLSPLRTPRVLLLPHNTEGRQNRFLQPPADQENRSPHEDFFWRVQPG